MAQQLAEDLWRLEIPLVGNPLKTLNSYLILGPRSLLIDTGFRQEPCREAMERELAEVGVDRDRMDVFLTHLHSDHTGLAPELVRPGCRVYIGAVDGQRMLAGQSEEAWRRLNAAGTAIPPRMPGPCRMTAMCSCRMEMFCRGAATLCAVF